MAATQHQALFSKHVPVPPITGNVDNVIVFAPGGIVKKSDEAISIPGLRFVLGTPFGAAPTIRYAVLRKVSISM